MEIEESKLKKFKNWLVSCGAVSVQTKPGEFYRVVTNLGKLSIVRSRDGFYKLKGSEDKSFVEYFRMGGHIHLKPSNHKLCLKSKAKTLLERDGDNCFYCGKPLNKDITIEHILGKSKGGANRNENLALAHKKCNLLAANLPIVKKIELRDRMRGYKD